MFRGFREIREVRIREVTDKKKEKSEDKNYLKIKPETDITAEEAKDFWDQFFENVLITNSQEH